MTFFARITATLWSFAAPQRGKAAQQETHPTRPLHAQTVGHRAQGMPASRPVSKVKFHSEMLTDARCSQRSLPGRWVMSGRMADVCAELDRLVALEAQPTMH